MACETRARTYLEGALKTFAALVDGIEARDDLRAEVAEAPVAVDTDELGELVVVEHRVANEDLATRLRARVEQVAFGADRAADRSDQLLANGVERRVGHLRELLREVVVEHAAAVGQHGQRGVGAHRAEGLFARRHHRSEEHLELFVRVAEHLLALQQRALVAAGHGTRRQVVEVDEVAVEPLLVRALRAQARLQLVVADDAALCRVDEEDATGLQAPLLDDRRLRNVDDADLGGHDDQVVVGDPVRATAAARCDRAPRR